MNMKAIGLRRILLVLFAVLLLTCTMAITVAAEETYVLDLNIAMRDDLGDAGDAGVKAYLAPGTPIVLEDLVAKYPALAETLEGYVLDADMVVGLPADGLMPARNLTVSATYTEIKDKYTVTFKYGHNTVLPTIVEHGKAAKAPANTDKASTATTVFEFTGWDVDFSNVTHDMVVTAQYTETDRLYTVTFNFGDGKTETVTVKYGEAANAPADTDKAATETATYTFKGWDAEFSEVTADITVNAVYEETPVVVPPAVNTEALQTAIDAYKAAGLDESAEALTKAEAALTDGTLTQDEIDALTAALQAAIDAAGQDSETESNSETAQPEDPTEAPEDTTERPTEENTTAAPAPDTETNRETNSVTNEEGFMKDWMWLILANIVVGAIAATVYILIRRDFASDSKPVEETSTTEKDKIAEKASLFIPLGEEMPEEEIIPEEIETLDEVSAETVDELMTDKLAETLLEESEEMGGTGKLGIINIGVISPVYQAGDVVTLASLQEKGLVDANIGRLKVLASGILDKPLTIKAEAFSFQAIKMITLTGGHAIHLKIGK